MKNIFFDIDDVLCPTTLAWLPVFNQEQHVNVRYKDIDHNFNIPGFPEGFPLNHLTDYLDDNSLWLPHREKKFIIDLGKRHGLSTLTDRFPSVQGHSKTWAFMGYGDIFHRHIFTKIEGQSKADICAREKPDLVIEDNVHNITSMIRLGIPVLIMNCPWNKHIPNENVVGRINCLREVENYL